MNTFKQSGKHLEIVKWQEQNSKIVAGFTTREGGNSSEPFYSMNMGFHVNDNPDTVRKNRKKFAESIGFPVENWVGSKQVHRAKIVKVSMNKRGHGSLDFETAIPDTDALYTSDEDILLTSLYADCVPLYFYAPNEQLVGLAHAGWKGTVAKIGPEMVKIWCEKENVDVKTIQAAIGPSIGDCCYEVDDRVINEVITALNGMDDCTIFKKNEFEKYQLNLKSLNEKLLLHAGVLQENIIISDQCTSCKNDIFFSHRKDMGKTGRMMSYIGRKGDLSEFGNR
ncbi:peptidoglycan editing factor PgeF [Fictibacillus sp. b24]|uniref:peptidoglycan editing factor PgeF n=1 Tax=Fictibacillus sp. b24 TaxID=3055863 RepID=UPI0025A29700|nr:peptidoglycan editing factor PgeF [Fictibacillus sp. b24]MDM5316618.1 peptidoglycan editing factor PgeF [Fictibacillus sp. b24]